MPRYIQYTCAQGMCLYVCTLLSRHNNIIVRCLRIIIVYGASRRFDNFIPKLRLNISCRWCRSTGSNRRVVRLATGDIIRRGNIRFKL